MLSADLVANSGFENQTVNLAIEPCVALGLTICPMAPGYVTLQLLLLTIKQLFSSPLFILGPIRKNWGLYANAMCIARCDKLPESLYLMTGVIGAAVVVGDVGGVTVVDVIFVCVVVITFIVVVSAVKFTTVNTEWSFISQTIQQEIQLSQRGHVMVYFVCVGWMILVNCSVQFNFILLVQLEQQDQNSGTNRCP